MSSQFGVWKYELGFQCVLKRALRLCTVCSLSYSSNAFQGLSSVISVESCITAFKRGAPCGREGREWS